MREDPLLFYADVIKIVRAKWRIALCIGIGAICPYFLKEADSSLKYISESSFKEVEASQDSAALSIFKTMFTSSRGSGVKMEGIVTSRAMLAAVVSEAGMQVASPRDLSLKIKNLKKKCLLDLGIDSPPPKELMFSKLRYQEKAALPFSIKCLSKDTFIYKRGKKEVKGTFFAPFSDQEVSFVLDPSQVEEYVGKEYRFVINSLDSCVDNLLKTLDIFPNLSDVSIIEMEYIGENPTKGNQFLKCLMQSYQDYLFAEHARIMNGQLSHLEERASSLGDKFQADLSQFAQFLKEHQMLSVESIAAELSTRLQLIEKNLEEDLNQRQFLSSSDFAVNAIDNPSLSLLTNQLNDFLSRRMTIDLNSLEDEKDSILGKIFSNLPLFQSAPVAMHQKEGLINQIEKSKGFINLGAIEEKKYIQDLISISGELLLESRLYKKESKDYSGLDLGNVYALYQKHCHHRDDSLLKWKAIKNLTTNLSQSNFEQILGSQGLSAYLSPDLVHQIHQVFTFLHDSVNRTDKEKLRLESDLERVYQLAVKNLKEVEERHRQELESAKASIKELNFAVLDLLNKQILLVKNQIHSQKKAFIEGIDSRIQRQKEIKEAILRQKALLPELLVEEKKLKMKAEMTKSMLQGLSQIVEGKMVAKLLSSIESKPLNEPYSTFSPVKSKILFKGAAIFTILFGGVIFLFVVGRIFRGLPISLDRLEFQGYRVGGLLNDRRTLRKITQGVKGVVGLFSQDGPDYSYDIAKLLATEGKRVLLIESHFNAMLKGEPQLGLFQYLSGETSSCTFSQMDGYDYLPMKGRSPFGAELMRSRRFKDLIASYKEHYEVILLYSSERLISVEAESLLEVCDLACVTLRDESEAILKPYQAWNENKTRITFVAYDDA
jgi:hypothetical protein